MLTVKELIELLQAEDPDADVYGVDWSTGTTYGIAVGRDEEDMGNDVYIEIYDI